MGEVWGDFECVWGVTGLYDSAEGQEGEERESWREGGREVGMEGGREGARERGRKGGTACV